MANAFDVAKYILEKAGETTAMKLQKLMYYCQAWHLVWAEEPLFADEFEAWANGPVIPRLYARHRGQFKVGPQLVADADVSRVSEEERQTIDKVLAFYGSHNAQWLSTLTHQERPWLETRGELAPGVSCTRVIPKGLIHEYYSAL